MRTHRPAGLPSHRLMSLGFSPGAWPRLLILLFLLGLLPAAPAPAGAASGKVALLPFDDLSRGANSVDLEMTTQVADLLTVSGINVVDAQAVRAYLATNRVRHTGMIDLFNTMGMREALGVDWILTGTVTHRRPEPQPALGLSLLLVDAHTGKAVWAWNESLAATELVKPLGIDAVTSLAAITDLVLARVPFQFPEPGEALVDLPIPPYSVESFDLSSRFVAGNGRMECRVGFRFDEEPPTDVFLKLGGKRISLVSMAKESGTYWASWQAPEAEGRYSVATVLRWKGRREESKFLASYRVVNEPPTVSLRFGNGVPLGDSGVIAFRSFLSISPVVNKTAPVASFRIQIEDPKTGAFLMDFKSIESLPEAMVWRGAGDQGPLGSGYYRLILTVTDVMGNEIADSAELYLGKNQPRVLPAMERLEDGRVQLHLMAVPDPQTGEMEPVPVKYWQLRVTDRERNFLLEEEGETLPATVTLDPGAETVFLVSYLVRDVLGNERHARSETVELPVTGGGEDQDKKETDVWHEEF
ncbi:MAG: hypothetical protein AB1634_02025 [Thermodesulfobacteriota bacterium]